VLQHREESAANREPPVRPTVAEGSRPLSPQIRDLDSVAARIGHAYSSRRARQMDKWNTLNDRGFVQEYRRPCRNPLLVAEAGADIAGGRDERMVIGSPCPPALWMLFAVSRDEWEATRLQLRRNIRAGGCISLVV
jgi:hypothetical protein